MTSLPNQWGNLAMLTIVFAVYTGVRFGLGMMYPLAAKALLGEEHAWYTPYTLPNVMFYVIDIATVIPMSNFMKKYGRRPAFLMGSAFGIIGALAGIGALRLASNRMLSYWLLVASALVVGLISVGGFARFAALEVCDKSFQANALSLVVSGGAFIGVFGPGGVSISLTLVKDAIDGYSLYLAFCLGLCTISGLCAALLRMPAQPTAMPVAMAKQPTTVSWMRFLRRPGIQAAMMEGLGVQIVMLALMTAFPLRMKELDLPIVHIGGVLQVHMLGMYAPGLFVGRLVDRWGTVPVIMIGWTVLGVSIAIALSSDSTLWSFYVSQLCVGAGWSFGYIGSSRLLTLHHTQEERTTVQGVAELIRFIGSAMASLLASVVPYDTLLWMSAVILVVVCCFSTTIMHCGPAPKKGQSKDDVEPGYAKDDVEPAVMGRVGTMGGDDGLAMGGIDQIEAIMSQVATRQPICADASSSSEASSE